MQLCRPLVTVLLVAAGQSFPVEENGIQVIRPGLAVYRAYGRARNFNPQDVGGADSRVVAAAPSGAPQTPTSSEVTLTKLQSTATEASPAAPSTTEFRGTETGAEAETGAKAEAEAGAKSETGAESGGGAGAGSDEGQQSVSETAAAAAVQLIPERPEMVIPGTLNVSQQQPRQEEQFAPATTAPLADDATTTPETLTVSAESEVPEGVFTTTEEHEFTTVATVLGVAPDAEDSETTTAVPEETTVYRQEAELSAFLGPVDETSAIPEQAEFAVTSEHETETAVVPEQTEGSITLDTTDAPIALGQAVEAVKAAAAEPGARPAELTISTNAASPVDTEQAEVQQVAAAAADTVAPGAEVQQVIGATVEPAATEAEIQQATGTTAEPVSFEVEEAQQVEDVAAQFVAPEAEGTEQALDAAVQTTPAGNGAEDIPANVDVQPSGESKEYTVFTSVGGHAVAMAAAVEQIRESATAEAEEGAEIQESATSEAEEGAEIQESATSEAEEGAETRESATAEAEEGAEIQESATAEAEEGAEIQESATAEAEEGAEIQESATAEAEEGAEIQESATAEAEEGAEIQESATAEAEEGAEIQESATAGAEEGAEIQESATSEAEEGAETRESATAGAEEGAEALYEPAPIVSPPSEPSSATSLSGSEPVPAYETESTASEINVDPITLEQEVDPLDGIL